MAKINKTEIYRVSDSYENGILLGSDMVNSGKTVNYSIQGLKEFIGPGQDGKSAYQVAVDNGFEGTEEEWLESLKGEDGTAELLNDDDFDI